MLALLADENLRGGIVAGLMHHEGIDVVRVQDIGLLGAEDPEVLAWAAENDRIVLTHDRATFPAFAYARVENSEPMPGVRLQ